MTTPPPRQPWDEPFSTPEGRPAPYGNPGAYAPRQDEQPWDPSYHPYADQYAAQNAAQQPAYPYYGYYGYGYGPQYQPPPVAPKKPRRGRLAAMGVGVVAAATAVGLAFASGTAQTVSGTALGSFDRGSTTAPGTLTPSAPSTTTPTVPTVPVVPNNGGNGGIGNSGGSGGSSTGTATAVQQVGVVDIVSTQGYNQAAAAGTGMILSSDGEILTNNHVIEDSTAIKVTVVSTGKTYTAKVVGTSPTNDIALLKLVGASGLKTINLGDSTAVSVGDKVTGVGNAGGKGGTPSAAAGKVTKLNKTITASDESGQNAETLEGVIVTDAPIQSGDSGGPLYNAKDEVIGIDTAASTSGTPIGFAIPINKALSIVSEIKKGIETSSIHIGYPGFLGISIDQRTTTEALVAGTLDGGPAAKAGIEAGDVITKVGGATITSPTQLQKAVSSHDPGSKVSITYTDPNTGGSKSVTVTLATGPAD